MRFVEDLLEAIRSTILMSPTIHKIDLPAPVIVEKEKPYDGLKNQRYALVSEVPNEKISFNATFLKHYIGDDSLIQTQECIDVVAKLGNSKSAIITPEQNTPELEKLVEKLKSLDVCDEVSMLKIQVWGNRKFTPLSEVRRCILADKRLEKAYEEVNRGSTKGFDVSVIEDVLKGTYGVLKVPQFYRDMSSNPDYAYHMEGKPSREMKRHLAQAQAHGLISLYGNNNHIMLNKEKFINVWLNSSLAQNYQENKVADLRIHERNQQVNKEKLKDKSLSSNERSEAYVALNRVNRDRFKMK